MPERHRPHYAPERRFRILRIRSFPCLSQREAAEMFRVSPETIARRRGGKKAAAALAASMLTSAFHMLTRAVPYAEAAPITDPRRQEETAKRLVFRLKHLGFDVQIRPAA